jgi:hypothetical protein
VQLFEFLDLPGLPRVLRTLATEYLQASQEIGGGQRVVDLVARRVESVLDERKSRQLVDLCSGSGGLMPAVARRLAERGAPVHVALTDLFPDPGAAARLSAGERSCVGVHPEPVDARAVPRTLQGARTIFIGFHHFPPAEARAVLADAVRAGEPILVFEGTERRLAALLPFALFSPLLVLALTPFIRPFRAARLFFTYLIPLVPLIVWWDGVVSHLRSYRCDELLELARGLGSDWRWDASRERIPGTPLYATSLIGLPPAHPEERW